MSYAAAPSPLLASLFPPGIVAAELRHAGDPALLLPAEREQTGRFAAKRLREFAAGRICARHALGELGIHDFALLSGPDRRPRWPGGVVGSITHTDGYCGVVVARGGLLRSIGLDAEIVDRVTPEILRMIATAREAAMVRSLEERAHRPMAALMFSAKEAFYKAGSLLIDRWIEFGEVELQIEEELAQEGRFVVAPRAGVALPVPLAAGLAGRYRFEGRIVLAGIAIGAQEQETSGSSK